MGSSMGLRALYLPANATIDLTAAKTVATRLCDNADADELATMLEEHHDGHAPIDGIDPPLGYWSDEFIEQHANVLRRWTERTVHRLIDEFADSLSKGDVARFRFDRDADTSHGVDAYLTGGVSSADSATDSYDRWDIVYDSHRFPAGWSDAIGTAAGLLHPQGTGPAARAVTFHTWA